MDESVIQKTVSEMFDALGLSAAPPSMKVDLMEAVGRNVMDRLVLELIKHVPDDVATQLAAKVGVAPIEEILALTEPHIPHLPQLVREVIEREYPRA